MSIIYVELEVYFLKNPTKIRRYLINAFTIECGIQILKNKYPSNDFVIVNESIKKYDNIVL